MSTFARIDDGHVAELFTLPEDMAGWPMSDLFHADLVWTDVSTVSPAPQPGWTASQGADSAWTFAPPPPPPPAPVPPPPTLAQIEAQIAALMAQVQAMQSRAAGS